jgi:hypothetical protein
LQELNITKEPPVGENPGRLQASVNLGKQSQDDLEDSFNNELLNSKLSLNAPDECPNLGWIV